MANKTGISSTQNSRGRPANYREQRGTSLNANGRLSGDKNIRGDWESGEMKVALGNLVVCFTNSRFRAGA
jgi:hypothetical protein